MKSKLLVLILITFYLFNNLLFASTITIKESEELYKNEQYELALKKYKLLLKSTPNNPNLLFNTGNTYFKLNLMGYAIGYYLKALKISPNESDYKYNLNIARKFIQQEKSIEKKSIFSTISKQVSKITFSTSLNLILLSIGFFLTTLFFLITKKRKNELFTNLTSISILFLLISSILFFLKLNESKIIEAVVVDKKISAHSGPSEKLSTLFYIHEGKLCEIKSQDNNWSEIKLSNGFIGWVKTSSLFLIN